MPSIDVDVVINLRARRGSEAVAHKARLELPGARVITSRSLKETSRFARRHDSGRSSLLLSAGGDGTAVALLNELRGARAQIPSLGVLPLGTGNGWAHATGAPAWRTALERLGGRLRSDRGGTLPLRRFELVEIDLPGLPSRIAHFAGTGWDAEIINDFNEQKQGRGVLPRSWRSGLAGYVQGLLFRTIPHHLGADIPEVEITNLGADALTVDETGSPVPLRVSRGVVYRGPANVCAAGTSESWGFGFRAFPFAGLVPGRFCLRVYSGSTTKALLAVSRLWRGAHPQPEMHTFLLDRCRCVFSRPVALQIGGDSMGERTEVEYRLAREQVDLLDWRRLAAA